MMEMPVRTRVGALLLACTLTASLAHAQTPATYEATPHGRVLACFGAAYALVELVDVATQNLSVLAIELRRPTEAARPAVAAGIALVGSQLDQQQSLEVAERLATCAEGLARRAAPDPAAAYAALAVREEIDVAIRMADGFASDYQALAERLDQFFQQASDPAAKSASFRGFARFADELSVALARSRTAISTAIESSTPRP
jgi:hypothetical protein